MKKYCQNKTKLNLTKKSTSLNQLHARMVLNPKYSLDKISFSLDAADDDLNQLIPTVSHQVKTKHKTYPTSTFQAETTAKTTAKTTAETTPKTDQAQPVPAPPVLAQPYQDKRKLQPAQTLQVTTGISFLQQTDDQAQLERSLKENPPSHFERATPQKDNFPRLPARSKPKIHHAQPQTTLDLHGYTELQALQRLQSFLLTCQQKGLHTVLVITGKGLHSGAQGPILLQVATQWLATKLAQHSIKSFARAPIQLGGDGAILIHFK